MARDAAATALEDGDYDRMTKIVKRRRRINKTAVHAELRLLRHERDVENAKFDVRLAKLAHMLFYEGSSDFREGADAEKYRPSKRSTRGGRRVQRAKRSRAAQGEERGVEPQDEASPNAPAGGRVAVVGAGAGIPGRMSHGEAKERVENSARRKTRKAREVCTQSERRDTAGRMSDGTSRATHPRDGQGEGRAQAEEAEVKLQAARREVLQLQQQVERERAAATQEAVCMRRELQAMEDRVVATARVLQGRAEQQAARVDAADAECKSLRGQLEELSIVSGGQVSAAKKLYERSEKRRQAEVAQLQADVQRAQEKQQTAEEQLSSRQEASTAGVAELRGRLQLANEGIEQLTACNQYQVGRIRQQEAELAVVWGMLRELQDYVKEDYERENGGVLKWPDSEEMQQRVQAERERQARERKERQVHASEHAREQQGWQVQAAEQQEPRREAGIEEAQVNHGSDIQRKRRRIAGEPTFYLSHHPQACEGF